MTGEEKESKKYNISDFKVVIRVDDDLIFIV